MQQCITSRMRQSAEALASDMDVEQRALQQPINLNAQFAIVAC